MTQEQKQQVVGRLIAEYQSADEDCAYLRVELNSIGRSLIELGQSLAENPEQTHIADRENPLLQKADALCDKLRAALETRKRARSQLDTLGVNLSDAKATAGDVSASAREEA